MCSWPMEKILVLFWEKDTRLIEISSVSVIKIANMIWQNIFMMHKVSFSSAFDHNSQVESV